MPLEGQDSFSECLSNTIRKKECYSQGACGVRKSFLYPYKKKLDITPVHSDVSICIIAVHHISSPMNTTMTYKLTVRFLKQTAMLVHSSVLIQCNSLLYEKGVYLN